MILCKMTSNAWKSISLLLLGTYFDETAEENAPVEKTFSSFAVFLRVKAGKAIMLRTHV